nr:PREDICTED: E3 ubiquitin-protein ligase RBBP6-like [Opisthocomus hoazin]
MSAVHYKFFSKLTYDMVTFNSLHISLCNLKPQIMGREELKASSCDLQITDAQTKEGNQEGKRRWDQVEWAVVMSFGHER